MAMNQPKYEPLVSRFQASGVTAIILMGSYARGDAGPFSDVDLVRFKSNEEEIPGSGTHLIDGFFVVVSDVSPSQVDTWFTNPEEATECIAGLRTARPLWDPEGYFKAIQKRASEFVWNSSLQDKANAYAGSQMVGWIEEVQKGLEGLRRGDEGRMLNAKHGFTWGMTRIMRVYRGVLISGDNASYTEVAQSMGTDSEWAVLSRRAFGLEPIPLAEQIRAGLRLYALTFEMLADNLRPEDKELIAEAVKRIRDELSPDTGNLDDDCKRRHHD